MAKECQAVKAYRESQARVVRNYRLFQDKAYARYAASCELAFLWYSESVVAEEKKGLTMINPNIIVGLDRYVGARISTGSFLRSVLENDLRGVYDRADDDDRVALFEICAYIYHHVPIGCYGSPDIVKAWLHED